MLYFGMKDGERKRGTKREKREGEKKCYFSHIHTSRIFRKTKKD